MHGNILVASGADGEKASSDTAGAGGTATFHVATLVATAGDHTFHFVRQDGPLTVGIGVLTLQPGAQVTLTAEGSLTQFTIGGYSFEGDGTLVLTYDLLPTADEIKALVTAPTGAVVTVELSNGDRTATITVTIPDPAYPTYPLPVTQPGTVSPRTLRHAETGITVKGYFNNNASLSVRQNGLHAEGSCAACDEMRRLAAASDVIVLYDISLTSRHSGPVDVYIPFPGTDGGLHTVLHCNNTVLEEHTGYYADGGVTTTWEKLSPFAVLKSPEVSVPDDMAAEPPKTGDAPHVWAGVLMISAAAALFAAAWLYVKRQHGEGR